MPDREKVFEAFRNCITEPKCRDCPWEQCEQFNQKKVEIPITLALDVINLLKERGEIKPYIDIDEAKCPICKVKLTRQELLGEDVLFEDFFDYCPHCGRSVKW